jgi:hypothetical protein
MSQGVYGCITMEPSKAGFHRFPHAVDTIESCLRAAEQSGLYCGKDANDTKAKCHYFSYSGMTADDYLKEGKKLYENGNKKAAFTIFFQVWKSYSPEIKKNYLETPSSRFMAPYGGEWLLKEFKKEFEKTASDAPVPLPVQGTCWVGGSQIMKDPNNLNLPNPYLIIPEEGNLEQQNQKGPCKYNLYEVPLGENGSSVQDKIINMYQRRVSKTGKELQKIKEKLIAEKVALQIAQKHVDPIDMLIEAKQVEKDINLSKKTKPFVSNIKEKQKQMKNALGSLKAMNEVSKASTSAAQSSQQLLQERKKVLHKIDADINNINWSLKETSRQTSLQNKISTTLGILIILFVALCVSLFIYYSFRSSDALGKIGSSAAKISDARSTVIDNIFGLGKKNKPPGSATKSAINKIFSF